MSRPKLRCLAVLVTFALATIASLHSQSAPDNTDDSRLEWDDTNEIFRFKWWSLAGHTYFIQHSEDLIDWMWLPVIEPGDNSEKEWGFSSTGDRFFLRVQHTDIPTTDPEGDDFDGDGVSNLAELMQDTSPFSNLDTDSDGLADDREIQIGSAANDPASGLDIRLLGHWPFDEQVGNTFADSTAGARTGALTASYQWSSNFIDRKHLEFTDDDATAIIPAADLPIGENDADFTVAFWVRLDEGPNGQWRQLIRKGEVDNNAHRTVALWIYPWSNHIHARVSGANDWNMGIDYGNTPLAVGRWTHVAFVKSGSEVRLYFDGQPDLLNGTADQTSVTVAEPTVANTGDLRLGKQIHGGIRAGFDDLRIYDVALTAAEIAELQLPPNEDPDYDGLTTAAERLAGTDPEDPDTDYDGNKDSADPDPLDHEVFTPVRLAHWTFDAPSLRSTAGDFPLFEENNSLAVPGIAGRALDIRPDVGSRLTLPDLNADGSANINLRHGTIRFWIKPDWSSANQSGTGPGSWARMIEVGTYSAPSTVGIWTLHFDPDGNHILFASTNALDQWSPSFAAPISWQADQWHQIVLTYSPTETRLHIDGGPPVVIPGIGPIPNASIRAHGFAIGTNRSGLDYWGERIEGQIDEFETFNYPLDAAEIYSNYAPTRAALNAREANNNIPPDWANRYFPPDGSNGAIPTDPLELDTWLDTPAPGGLTNREKMAFDLDPHKESTKDIGIPDEWLVDNGIDPRTADSSSDTDAGG